MNLFEAVVLGIVQGLTEFLPVSSSGHLVLLQRLLGIKEPALLFDTMLHLGTLVAVLVVLRKDILAILRKPFQRMTALLLIACVPTFAFAMLFQDAIEAAFHSGATLGWSFLFTGAVLLSSEALARRVTRSGGGKGIETMTWLDAALIGTLQGVAIFPAVSRSGMTISGALARGLDRDLAARFSFLLSIPVILGAAVFQSKDLILDGAAAGDGFTLPLVVGTIVAGVVGGFAVKFAMDVIKKSSLKYFAFYVFGLGALVLLDQNLLHVFF